MNANEIAWGAVTITGSSFVGKIVMRAAAEHLTPVTLELGGKNPTFVDRTADIALAAERMVLAKTHNSGQWCVDVDYVLVDESVVEEFTNEVVATAKRLLGDEAAQRGDGIPTEERWFNRIVNERNAQRLQSMLEEDHGGEVVLGGLEHVDVAAKFFPLTVVRNPRAGTKLFTEEIFGPIMVIQSVPGVDAAIKVMKETCDTPLALYVYSNDDAYVEKVLQNCASGGVRVNSTVEHMAAHSVPFGGFGQSGFGAYHGKAGFDEYSHLRSIFYRSNEKKMVYIPRAVQPNGNRVPSALRDAMVKAIKAQGESVNR